MGRMGNDLTRRAAAEIEHLLDEAIAASRLVTAELSPPVLQEGGLRAGLRWLGRQMAERHGLRVDLTTEEELPPLGEEVRVLLFESVRELLFNAVKHARVASAKVDVRRIAAAGIQITVGDSGPGFDPDSLKKAGETGGGFGLFSIRERLGMLGGRMDIDSAPGRGSRFTMTAPAGGPASVAPPVVSAPPPPTGAERAVTAGSPAGGTSIRVLVVDDHAVVREGLRRLLVQEPDIQVAGEAVDGREAVEMAGRLRPDVILMDLNMPKLDGVEATRAIHNAFPDIRVIGLSMYEDAARARAIRDAGAVDYLSKSNPPRDVLAAIHRACRMHEEDRHPPELAGPPRRVGKRSAGRQSGKA